MSKGGRLHMQRTEPQRADLSIGSDLKLMCIERRCRIHSFQLTFLRHWCS